MIRCCYVGGETSNIGEIEFDTVGQRALFTEKGFGEVVRGGAAFIPEAMFIRLRFLDVELRDFGPIGLRCDPPQSFCDKLARGQQLFRDISQELFAGKSVESVLSEFEDSGVERVSAT